MDTERPAVVVTHHAPHPLCLPPAARSAWAAGISASDLSALIEGGRPALWVHGHIHARLDITHAGTRIVYNAAGPGFTKPGFQEDWVIEV
jgi:Icc-related predicted phosphoesterase